MKKGLGVIFLFVLVFSFCLVSADIIDKEIIRERVDNLEIVDYIYNSPNLLNNEFSTTKVIGMSPNYLRKDVMKFNYEKNEVDIFSEVCYGKKWKIERGGNKDIKSNLGFINLIKGFFGFDYCASKYKEYMSTITPFKFVLEYDKKLELDDVDSGILFENELFENRDSIKVSFDSGNARHYVGGDFDEYYFDKDSLFLFANVYICKDSEFEPKDCLYPGQRIVVYTDVLVNTNISIDKFNYESNDLCTGDPMKAFTVNQKLEEIGKSIGDRNNILTEEEYYKIRELEDEAAIASCRTPGSRYGYSNYTDYLSDFNNKF